MKITITYSCGHTAQVEIFGSGKERENKIKWLEKGICKDCYKKQQEEETNKNDDYVEIEMKYSDYKNNYANSQTKLNSYNPDNKTIIVYVNKLFIPLTIANTEDDIINHFLPSLLKIKAMENNQEKLNYQQTLYSNINIACKKFSFDINSVMTKFKIAINK